MKTRILHTKIWKDSYFSTLTSIEKLLFIYFLTNEYVNIIHLYELPLRVILFDTGVSQSDLENCKNKFEANKKIYFYKDFVYLSNASKYETYSGDRNEIAKQNTYKQLGKDVLEWFYKIPDTPPIGVYIPTINHKSEIINQKQEIINQKSIEEIKKDIRLKFKEKNI